MVRRYGFKAILAILGASLCLSQANAAVSCEIALVDTSMLTQESLDTSIRRLAEMRLDMEVALANRSPKHGLLKGTYLAKEAEVLQFVESKQIMTKEELRQRMKEIIFKSQNKITEEKKEEVIKRQELKESFDVFNHARQMIIFNFVKPGKFIFTNYGTVVESTKTEISQPFAMMSTPVTQMMWAVVKVAVGERDIDLLNPSFNKEGEGSVSVLIDGVPVQMKADYPVEMLDRPQANQFVKDVNELSSSEDPAIQALLLRIIPDHKPGDVYDLPTEAQWAFVARNRGKNYKDYFDRDDSSLVPDYAWVGVNSGDHTHAVGTRKPRVLDEQVYYDIEGNVMVWSKDRDAGYGGKDPIGKINSPYALALGSYFSSTGLATNIMKKFDMMDHDAKRPWLGLRLIRKLPQKKNFLQKLWGR